MKAAFVSQRRGRKWQAAEVGRRKRLGAQGIGRRKRSGSMTPPQQVAILKSIKINWLAAFNAGDGAKKLETDAIVVLNECSASNDESPTQSQRTLGG
jgi:hypothetical protein